MRLVKFEIVPSSGEFGKYALINPEHVVTVLARTRGGTAIVMNTNVYYNCVEDVGRVAARLLYSSGDERGIEQEQRE